MDDHLFNIVLSDNLINPKDYQSHPEKITTLECFHYNLPAHPAFDRFKFLTELRIMEQDVVDLEWLKDCPELTKLIVFHTLLEDTSGLKYSPKIVHLHLDGNKIHKFPDIAVLPLLEELSVSNNPFDETPKYPAMPTLKRFNIADSDLLEIDESISNFENLEVLNISGNRLPDFNFIHAVKPLQKLKELYLSDPQYKSNPISLQPNYETIVINSLPQISILDTFIIPDKFRQIAQNRINEVELYYQNCSLSELSNLQIASKNFEKELDTDLKFVKPNIDVKINEIYSIYDSFESTQRSLEQFIPKSYELAFRSGGTINFVRINEESDEWQSIIQTTSKKVEISTSSQLTAAWRINHSVARNELFERTNNNILIPRFGNDKRKEPSQTFLFYRIPELKDCVDILEHWSYNAQNEVNSKTVVPTVQIDKDTSSLLVVDEYSNEEKSQRTYFPVYLLFFSILNEGLLGTVDRICERGTEKTISPVMTDENIVTMHNTPFEILKSTLTSVTLIDCGISDFSLFQNLEVVKTINLSHNHITSLRTLPHLPMLQSLDVSFNRIEKVSDLIPEEHAITALIEHLSIFGNPVCTPMVLQLISQIFPQVEYPLNNDSLKSIPTKKFVTNLTEMNLDSSLTILDISNNCYITSLSPLNNLKKLKKLFCANNSLEKIDFSSFNLTFADFSNNKITTFCNYDQFPAIECLLLNYNAIEIIPKNEFSSILSLYISGNPIEIMPTQQQFPNIICLYCSETPFNSKVTDLRLLYQFPKLKLLNSHFITPQQHQKAKQSFNGIVFVEDVQGLIGDNKNDVDLSDREYTDVNSLEGKNVHKLNLANNMLKSISWRDEAFPRLTDLSLANNDMQNFDFLNFLPNLRSLDLSQNKLNDEMLKSLCGIKKLTKLTLMNLSNNSFRNIPMISQSFPNLDSIDLSHNYILAVAPNSFDGIKSIDLSYNSLPKLDNIACASLLSLDISHNRVQQVDEVYKIASKAPQITKFSFHDNPLQQRVSPRIRCIAWMRSLKEMDGKLVTEADLQQARVLLEQGAISSGNVSSSSSSQLGAPPGRGPRVNNVNLGFGLPALQNPQPARRQQGRKPGY